MLIGPCPRCIGGQLVLSNDDGKWEVECIQCAYTKATTLEALRLNSKPQPTQYSAGIPYTASPTEGRATTLFRATTNIFKDE